MLSLFERVSVPQMPGSSTLTLGSWTGFSNNVATQATASWKIHPSAAGQIQPADAGFFS